MKTQHIEISPSDSTLRTRITSLLALADDPSDVIQEHVAMALEHYQDYFEEVCSKLQIPLSEVDRENVQLLLAHRKMNQKRAKIESNKNNPLFNIGDLIKHTRYGYTGLVVSTDAQFSGNLEWYASNQTQPDRNQPWYHILVHQSAAATYSAQSSLIEHTNFHEISHPALNRYFESHDNHTYLRNNTPWP